MDTRQRAQLGRAAVDAGSVDRGRGDERASAIDTVASILHHLDSIGEEDPAAMLSSAATHYFAEKDGAP